MKRNKKLGSIIFAILLIVFTTCHTISPRADTLNSKSSVELAIGGSSGADSGFKTGSFDMGGYLETPSKTHTNTSSSNSNNSDSLSFYDMYMIFNILSRIYYMLPGPLKPIFAIIVIGFGIYTIIKKLKEGKR